eukprot:3477721-Pyramimonas_sp.AAC.1
MGCYNWARATAHFARTRIGQAYMEQFEKTKPMTWEEKAEAKKQEEEDTGREERLRVPEAAHPAPTATRRANME